MERVKNYVADKVGDMKKPEANLTDVDLEDIGRDGITYLAKVAVMNPYVVPIPISDIAYTLKSSERVIASGKVPDPGSLKARDTTMLKVSVMVAHSVLVSLIKDIATDWDIDYEIQIQLIIDLPVIGNFTIPLTQKGEMKLPTFRDMFM